LLIVHFGHPDKDAEYDDMIVLHVATIGNFWADAEGEHYEHVAGKIGFPFFGELILDCLNHKRAQKGISALFFS